MTQPEPAVWDEPAMRRVLAVRDVSGVFQLLMTLGYTQRRLAELAGMGRSQVCEIVKGRRQVQGYEVLIRIADGFGIPRGLMGLAYDGGEEPPEAPEEEVDEEMKRRALMAAGSIALFNSPVLGELLHIPVRPATPTPLPARLDASDVAAMRTLTESLRTVARTHGGCAETVTAVATRSLRLMSVPASDEIQAAMGSALANLHTMAGWTCVDSGYHDHARACFATAMELAAAADDSRELASAFRHAGIQMGEAGGWNDALKAFQLGFVGTDDEVSIAWLHAETAWPYALMGRKDQALTALKRSHEQPLTDPFDSADMDYVTACVYSILGQLDTAESFAARSVRKWAHEGVSRRDSVEADILLATLHARAGELDTAALARKAITGVAGLQSVRARHIKLAPLAQALEARPSYPEFSALAIQARQVMRFRQPSSHA